MLIHHGQQGRKQVHDGLIVHSGKGTRDNDLFLLATGSTLNYFKSSKAARLILAANYFMPVVIRPTTTSCCYSFIIHVDCGVLEYDYRPFSGVLIELVIKAHSTMVSYKKIAKPRSFNVQF